MTLVRLETIHPMLVHLTIGGAVLLVIAYAVSAIRRSEQWSFAGDVILLVTTLITLATAAFGLISNWALPWPGGLGLWRWLHLGLGVLSTALLGTITYTRWRKRIGHAESKSAGVLFGSIATMLVVFGCGWVGGEVLVYHGGMAVKAAGYGALAPSVFPSKKPPGSLHDSMYEIRGAWSPITTTTAEMLVHQPAPEKFKKIEENALRLDELGQWIQGKAKPHEYMQSKNEGDDYKGQREKNFQQMSAELARLAKQLADAAKERDIEKSTQTASEMTNLCASCHYALRW